MYHLARSLVVLLFTITLLASPGVLASPAGAKVTVLPPVNSSANPMKNLNEYETRVVHLINKRRAKRGLASVRRIQTCQDNGSEGWARRLTRMDSKRHRKMKPILNRCDLRWVGEVIAWGGSNPAPYRVVKAWMKSPAHKKVIMTPRARIGGVGAKRSASGELNVVLTFGRR